MPKSILPHIGRRGWPSPLALDQLNLILGAHLPQNYGCLPKPPAVSVGGLAPWQKRRTTELLYENMAGRIRLSQLARECGLLGQPLRQVVQSCLGCIDSQMAGAATG